MSGTMQGMIKKLLAAGMLCALAAVPVTTDAKDSVAPVTNHDGVPGTWLDGAAGFAQAAKIHRETGKPMIIYVYTDWCPYCQKVNKGVLPNEKIQSCLANFERVKLNPERSKADENLARQLRIRGYPTMLVRQEGDLMMRPLNAVVGPDGFLAQCQQELKR